MAMNHVTSAGLWRPLARIKARLALTSEHATWHGWQIERAGLAGVRVRDPRFDQLQARNAAPAGRR